MTHLHTPDDPRIFVFGSNLLGIHGAGAAWYAHNKLGHPWGKNWHVGLGKGRSYALPTCSEPGVPLPLETVRFHVEFFLDFAEKHSDQRFFVSAVGCGLAGFAEAEIAPLFKDAPENCDLPPGWR